MSRAFSPTVAWCCDKEEAPPEKTPEEVQAIVDEQIAEFNKTVTPWIAKEEISIAQHQAPAEIATEMSVMSFHSDLDANSRTVIIQQPAKVSTQEGKHTYKGMHHDIPG